MVALPGELGHSEGCAELHFWLQGKELESCLLLAHINFQSSPASSGGPQG
jgi:hypothetical protein